VLICSSSIVFSFLSFRGIELFLVLCVLDIMLKTLRLIVSIVFFCLCGIIMLNKFKSSSYNSYEVL
jgi:hypothetical protein